MPSDNINQAVARGASTAVHLVNTGASVVNRIKSNGLNLPSYQLENNHHRSLIVSTHNPASQPVNALTSPTFTDFRLVSSESVHGVTLALSVSCDTATANFSYALTTDFVFSLINYVEVLGENSSVVIQRIDRDDLINAFAQLPREVYLPLQKAILGIDYDIAATTANATMVDGDSRTLYLPLMIDILSQFEIIVSALSSPVTLRFYWRGTHAATNLSLQNASMLVSQWHYDNSVRSQQMAAYNGPKIDHRYFRRAYMRSQETITPGNRFSMRLSSVQGLVTSMTLIVRLNDVVQKVDRFEILDPQGQNIVGGTVLSQQYCATILRADTQRYFADGTSTEPIPVSEKFVNIPISTQAHHSEAMGQLSAYLPVSGQHQLIFYLAGSGATASYEVTILYSAASVMSINRGQISISHS
jgi:hypothetical protein